MHLHPLTLPLLILFETSDTIDGITGRTSRKRSPLAAFKTGRRRTAHPLELEIHSGQIRGEHLEFDGEPFMIFKGIPYAAPPVGARRFQRPAVPAEWRGVMNATRYAHSCIQEYDAFKTQELGAFYGDRRSEDCLYLNVFAPRKFAQNESYPVMVWIHGGGFQIGSSSDYKQDPILRHFVSLGTVFITLNYRLGPMGFVSTKDEILPGNVGLWDIIMALEWVQTNAHVFSGDKNRVTLVGHGSGASAASILAVSPKATGLFQRAIMLSGTALSPGVVRDTAVNATDRLQRDVLHCRALNSTEVLNCLKLGNRANLLDPKRPRVYYDDYQEFVPMVDGWGNVIPKAIETLVREKPKIPILLGTTRNESALRLSSCSKLN